jgi:hypothetical protein
MKVWLFLLLIVLLLPTQSFAQSTDALVLVTLEGFDREIRVDKDFVPLAEGMGRLAKDSGITILVQQSFRRAGEPVKAAVVPPSSTSNHLVGNALDVNLKFKGKRYTSKELRLEGFSALPKEVKAFILSCEKSMRWGGRFESPGEDPIHFDSNLHVKDRPGYERKYRLFQTKAAWEANPVEKLIDQCVD